MINLKAIRYSLDALNTAVISQNKNWGVYGDQDDLNDKWAGYAKYSKELVEFGIADNGDNKPKDGLYDSEGSMMFDKNKRFGFGAEDSWKGLYRVMPCREVCVFEFDMGDDANGVKGYIDLLDDDNPYGPKSSPDKFEMEKNSKHAKMISSVTAATRCTESGIEISPRGSIDSQSAISKSYVAVSPRKATMSSIYLERKLDTMNHIEIAPNSKKLLYDEAVNLMKI